MLSSLGVSPDDVAILSHADAADSMAMASLAESCRVLLACLPDYRAAGDAMVRACTQAGTHYLDLSVETDLHAKVGLDCERSFLHGFCALLRRSRRRVHSQF